MPGQEKLHVAALAFPFGSHPTPLLHLVRRLAAAAPDVHFSYFNTTKSNHRVVSKVSLHGFDNVKMYDVEDGVPEGHVFSGNPVEPIEIFIKATPDNFRRRLDEAVEENGKNITCLLTDAFLWFSADIGNEMGIPWISFWTAGPMAISIHLYTDVLINQLELHGKKESQGKTLDFLPGLSAIHVNDLPREMFQLNSPFSDMLHKMSLSLPKAKAVLLNSFDGIDSTLENDLKSKLQNFLNIGPFPLPSKLQPNEDPSDCLSWLSCQKDRSVAYLSFGTMLTPPPPELLALGEALEEKNIPYLWSFRDDSKKSILDGFFERTKSMGKVVRWTPQLDVLAHPSIGVFVTHCGWNSVMESVVGGVPMICRPFFGDQMINKRIVEDVWRIGVGMEGGVFTKSNMVNALDVIMWKEDGRKMRESVGRLKQCVTEAVAENGTSSKNFGYLLGMVTTSTQGS